MSTDADIGFLVALGRQLEAADEALLRHSSRRLRRLMTATAVFVCLIAVAGGAVVWSQRTDGGASSGGGSTGGGGEAKPLSPPVPAPAAPGMVLRGPLAVIPDVPLVTQLAADASGHVWLAGRGARDRAGWVAYLDGGAWHTVPPAALPQRLWLVEPISPGDVWFAVTGGFLHWDGIASTATTVPFLGGDVGGITDMAATASDSVWAVGRRAGKLYKTPDDGPGEHTQGSLPIAMHWDGSAWADVSVPDYPGRRSELVSVSAKQTEAWAVGSYEQKLGEREQTTSAGLPMLPVEIIRRGPIVVRWDGKGWRAVDVAGLDDDGGADLTLEDVQVLGPDDVWVLGEEQLTERRSAAVVARWDGTAWSRIPPPDGVRLNDDHALYRTLSATSDTDLWLGADGHNGVGDAELAHWDGSSWQTLPMEAFDAKGQGTIGAAEATVLALSPNDVWFNAGFTSYFDNDPQAAVPSVAHWDGHAWSPVELPD